MSLKDFIITEYKIQQTPFLQDVNIDICQSDYPLDWYQEEFIPYAQEYQSLPDRKLGTILKWMEGYIHPAADYFGDSLLLLAHYYMGGEIVKLIQHFGGLVGDSYELALMAVKHPEKKVIVESAVHFMVESISIMADPSQRVYITNPKSGCTMEMFAKDFMVEPAIEALNARYGRENILPICYMNTSGRIKALCGEQGGSCCTSSSVGAVFRWAINKNKKILFIPDKNMGESAANWVGIRKNELAYWPGGTEGAHFNLEAQGKEALEHFDEAKIVLFSSLCGVHEYYTPEMVKYWQEKGYHVITHPECKADVLNRADSYGSTKKIWDLVTNDRAKTKKYAIATENHMVENVKQYCATKGIGVVNVGDAKLSGYQGMGCGCATMSRNDPPHLVATLDLLRQGKTLDYNLVRPGDVVNEFTGTRQRLSEEGQAWVSNNAKKCLAKMVEIVEQAK